MARARCIICTSEDEYTKRLCNCINSSADYNIQVKAVTHDKMTEKVNEIYDDILIVSGDIYEKLQESNYIHNKTMILCDEKEYTFYNNAILMYKPFEEIINNIVGIATTNMWINTNNSSKVVDNKIYAIISPSGNEYKSLCALDFARYMAETKRTLYLNFDTFSGIRFSKSDTQNMSDLIYLYQSESATYEDAVKNMMYIEGNLCALNPVNDPLHAKELSLSDIFEFTESLMTINGTSCVVLDIGKEYQDYAHIFKQCNNVINVVSSLPYGRRKNAEFEEYLEVMELGQLKKQMTITDPGNIYMMDNLMETSDERRGYISTIYQHLNS